MTPLSGRLFSLLCALTLGFVVADPAAAQGTGSQTYTGNGNTGGGGAVGTGSLTLSSDATNLYFSFTQGASTTFNHALVFYFDTNPDGATQMLTSGERGSPPGGERAVRNEWGSGVQAFPSNFASDYAYALRPSDFSSLYNTPSSNNFSFNSNINTSTSSGTYTWSIPLSTLGLGAGETFTFVTTYLDPYGGSGSDATFRFGETFGNTLTGTGFDNTTFGTALTYTVVPEPGTWAAGVLLFVGVGLMQRRRLAHIVGRK